MIIIRKSLLDLKKKLKITNRGFSLIQVVIAVAILGMAYIPVSSLFIASTRNIKGGDLKLSATLAAQTMIDELKHDRTIFRFQNKEIKIPSNIFPTLRLNPELVKYYKAIAIIKIRKDEKFPTILRKITVNIKYSDHGSERNIYLSTIAADNKSIHYRNWK